MRRPLPALALALALALQPGCAAMVRYHTPSTAAQPSGPTTTQRSLGFLWGLIPPAKISLEQCGPAGIQEMKVKQGLIDGLITYVTFGLVVSTKVKVTCAAPEK
jgi:hypothetical protein